MASVERMAHCIKQFLEDRLGSSVDITTRDSLHPRLRDRIEQSAVHVF